MRETVEEGTVPVAQYSALASPWQILLLAGWALAASPLRANDPPCRADALSFRVKKFETKRTSRLQALLQLGIENHLCFGIETVDEELRGAAGELSLANTPVPEIIQKILSPSSQLTVRQDGMVIRLFRPGDTTRNWLDFVVVNFESPIAPRHALSQLLFMTFALQNDPSIRGFAGSYDSDQGSPTGPWKESSKSIREILGRLVSAGGAGTWIAHSSSIRGNAVPRLPFWKVLDYSVGSERLMSIAAEMQAASNESSRTKQLQ